MEVPSVGISWHGYLLLFATLRRIEKQTKLQLIVRFKITGVDSRRFVGHRVSRLSAGKPEFYSPAKVTGMIETPCFLNLDIFRERFAISAMQTRPVLFECGTGIGKC